MAEEVAVAAVEHEEARHDDLVPHHVREGDDGSVGVDLKELVDDLRVRGLVPLLVGGDGAADLSELEVAVLLRVAGGVAV